MSRTRVAPPLARARQPIQSRDSSPSWLSLCWRQRLNTDITGSSWRQQLSESVQYNNLRSFNSEFISGSFEVRFELHSKRWVFDWAPKQLKRFHNTWATDLTSISPCLGPTLSLQKKSTFHAIFSTRFESSSSHWDSWITFDLYVLNIFMKFYFCGKYIYTNGHEKDVERDMYAALPYFRDSNDHDGYEKWKKSTWRFFQIFLLDTWGKVSLYSNNEVGWRSLLVMGRQSYQLSRLVSLTRSSYSVYSTPREPTI